MQLLASLCFGDAHPVLPEAKQFLHVLRFTKTALKDAKKIKQAGLKSQVQNLLYVIQENPFHNPPSYEKLVGDLIGVYSRRINIQHRLVYQVLKDEKVVKVIRMWTH